MSSLLVAVMLAAALARAAPEPQPFGPSSLDAIRRAHPGRPFILSLWSVTCEPCRHEMPMWRELQAKHAGLRVVLVATDGPGERERVARFLERYDPGPADRWQYADDFEERIRFSIDPRWRGELPRTYYFDARHQVEARTGVPDVKWLDAWAAKVSAP